MVEEKSFVEFYPFSLKRKQWSFYSTGPCPNKTWYHWLIGTLGAQQVSARDKLLPEVDCHCLPFEQVRLGWLGWADWQIDRSPDSFPPPTIKLSKLFFPLLRLSVNENSLQFDDLIGDGRTPETIRWNKFVDRWASYNCTNTAKPSNAFFRSVQIFVRKIKNFYVKYLVAI